MLLYFLYAKYLKSNNTFINAITKYLKCHCCVFRVVWELLKKNLSPLCSSHCAEPSIVFKIPLFLTSF